MKMMSDYSCGVPLWGADERSDEAVLTFPRGLPPALIKELIAWQNHFDQHFHYDDTGWDGEAAEREYARTGRRLHAWLEAELREAVELDLWPVREEWRAG